MKVFDRILLEIKHPKELIYKGINYSMWYSAYSMPILYQKRYGEQLESVGITMSEVIQYNRNMHSILGRMPFQELMKQNPMYAFKNTYGRNPFRHIILWANEMGYEYDYYYKNIMKDYINSDGSLDNSKLEENYKEYLEENYIKAFKKFCNLEMEDDDIYDVVENEELLECFGKSYKVYINKKYCVILNRVVEENQISQINEELLINSYIYKDEYRIDNHRKKLTTSPEKYFNTLGYDDFSKANFVYACLDNFEKSKKYSKEIMSVTIQSKNYILESLAKISNDDEIKALCDKNFVFMQSVENRAYKRQYMRNYSNQPYNVTYEEVVQYRNEMNDEINN